MNKERISQLYIKRSRDRKSGLSRSRYVRPHSDFSHTSFDTCLSVSKAFVYWKLRGSDESGWKRVDSDTHYRNLDTLLNDFVLFKPRYKHSKPLKTGKWQLVKQRIHDRKQEELIIPIKYKDLLSDLFKKDGEIIQETFSNIVMGIDRGQKFDALERLKELQTVFGLAKSAFPPKSLNYELFDEIQTHLINLMVAVETNNEPETKKIVDGIKSVFDVFVDTNKSLEYKDKDEYMPIIEDTGETLGGMRIYSVK